MLMHCTHNVHVKIERRETRNEGVERDRDRDREREVEFKVVDLVEVENRI